MTDTGRLDPQPADPPRPLRHVPALDGLRGVAAAGVLLHHADLLTGGWLGVDLFFVLSGYLITTLLVVEHRRSERHRIDLRRFWVRRVRRLAPALLLTVTGVALYAATIAPARQRLSIRWDGLAALGEVANWRFIAVGSDYWAQFTPPSPLDHVWSLSVEEQLYLLWPLVVAAVLWHWRRPAAVAVTATVGAVVSVAVALVLERRGASITRIYEGTDTRAFGVLLGAAVAAWRLHVGPTRWRASRTPRIIAGTAAAVGLGVLWAVLDGADRGTYRGPLLLAGVLGALVVAGVTDPRRGGPLGRVLSLPPLTFLGRISYGLYLYHWPIFLWLDGERTGLDGLALLVPRAGVSIGLAALSHRLIEQPIRRGALPGHRGRAAVAVGLTVAAIAVVAGTWGARPAPSATETWALAPSDVPDAPTVVYAGDSVALLLAMELGEQVDELGVNAGALAAPGCHLLGDRHPIRSSDGTVRTDIGCGDDARLREAMARYRPDVSLLLYGRAANEQVEIGGDWLLPCAPDFQAAYRSRLIEVVDALQSGGGDVVLVSSPGSSVSWVLDAAPPGLFDRVQCLNDELRSLADERDGVAFVDLAALVCPEPERCLDEIDGVDLRPDTVHFEGPSAALVNRWLIPRALAAAAAEP